MRKGVHSTKIKNTTWLYKLQQPRFKPSFIRDLSSLPYAGGCGTAAISVLTGIHPKTVDKYLPKNTDAWSDLEMKRFLRKRGYKVTEITVARVTQDWCIKIPPITHNHVLLLGQEIYLGEATWSVVNKNSRYHNFEWEPLSPLEFINNPTMTVYAITHKKWNLE